MTLELSDQYYLKALDWYPCDLEACIEALNYALSYDPEHSPAHCLVGKICGHKLKDPERAFHHMELSLLYDPLHLDAFYSYLFLLIQYGYLTKADKVMRKSMKVHGIDEPSILLLSAQSHERRGNFYIAKISLEHAKYKTDCCEQIRYIDTALKRLKTKSKLVKEEL